MMAIRDATIFLAIAGGLIFLFSSTSAPNALETKRVSDYCDATFGFGTLESEVCKRIDDDAFDMAMSPDGSGL